MGAATALLHADRDHSLAGIVVDSGFASLKQLVKELVKSRSKVPFFLVKGGVMFINKKVK